MSPFFPALFKYLDRRALGREALALGAVLAQHLGKRHRNVFVGFGGGAATEQRGRRNLPGLYPVCGF